MDQRNGVTKTLSIIGLMALTAVAAWQFYVFATFKDESGAVDLQGGALHLWLAIGIAVLVCVGGFFLLSTLLRYDRRNEMHITTAGPIDAPAYMKDRL